MYVSHETAEQTRQRLLRVLAAAEMYVYESTFAFEETPRGNHPPNIRPGALALVGDEDVWSQLVPSADSEAELFTVFRFHFPPRPGQQRVRRVAGYSIEAGGGYGRICDMRPE